MSDAESDTIPEYQHGFISADTREELDESVRQALMDGWSVDVNCTTQELICYRAEGEKYTRHVTILKKKNPEYVSLAVSAPAEKVPTTKQVPPSSVSSPDMSFPGDFHTPRRTG